MTNDIITLYKNGTNRWISYNTTFTNVQERLLLNLKLLRNSTSPVVEIYTHSGYQINSILIKDNKGNQRLSI